MACYQFAALAGLCLGLAAQTPAGNGLESVYTNLAGRGCKLLSVQEEGANSTQSCPGAGGYRVLVLDSDARMSVTLVDPAGRKWRLNLWQVVTRSFSSVGPRAEWRVKRSGESVRPVAVIVPVNANEDPNASGATAYLAVAKITPGESCVVAKIKPSANAMGEARAEADDAASKPCLKELE